MANPVNFDKWYISPELEARMIEAARRLRREATATENILWERLRRNQLGIKFRRQVPIGPFVVDFMCPEARLIVEVDGPIHEAQKEADQDRQALIETIGLHFVRFTTDEVEHHLPE